MNRVLMLALALVPFTGCLAAKLGPGASDHHLQTRAIVERCAGSYYDGPCSPDLLEDLTAMCDQAEAISAALAGEDPAQCAPEGEDR